jgi:predicted  nucleic acid-binding Zn-ribbon protein
MRQLIVLRDIDEEIATVGSGLARIPEEREAIERELVEARETLAQTRQSLESDEVEERRLEGKMREQEALLQRLNAQSAQVTSPQAYEALQHELQHASTASSEFETRALELMESIDQLRGEVSAAEDRLQRAVSGCGHNRPHADDTVSPGSGSHRWEIMVHDRPERPSGHGA